MEIQNIYLKNVYEIMSEYHPVYPAPYTWEQTISYMLNDREEKTIVDGLIQELKNSSNNTFREPIKLDERELDDDDLKDDVLFGFSLAHVEVRENGEKYVKNVSDGTHRLVAAYLAGVDDILVSEDWYGTEHPYVIVTDIKNHDEKIELTDEESDLLFWITRSLRISEEYWITSSISSGQYGNTSTYWDFYSDKIELHDITTKVEERLKKYFPQYSFTVNTFLEPWDDEEETKADEELWNTVE